MGDREVASGWRREARGNVAPEGKDSEQSRTFGSKDVTPTPGGFLQEWQTKDLCLTRLVGVAAKGLKVVEFSASCEVPARVASKGLTEYQGLGEAGVPKWE